MLRRGVFVVTLEVNFQRGGALIVGLQLQVRALGRKLDLLGGAGAGVKRFEANFAFVIAAADGDDADDPARDFGAGNLLLELTIQEDVQFLEKEALVDLLAVFLLINGDVDKPSEENMRTNPAVAPKRLFEIGAFFTGHRLRRELNFEERVARRSFELQVEVLTRRGPNRYLHLIAAGGVHNADAGARGKETNRVGHDGGDEKREPLASIEIAHRLPPDLGAEIQLLAGRFAWVPLDTNDAEFACLDHQDLPIRRAVRQV